MIFQLSMSLGAMTSGPLFGVFCLGILFPWANDKVSEYIASASLGVQNGDFYYYSSFVLLGSFLWWINRYFIYDGHCVRRPTSASQRLFSLSGKAGFHRRMSEFF